MTGVSRSRTAFHRELERLQHEVLVLGSMVEKATLRALDALRVRNIAAARAIEADDTLINRKRFELEDAALLLIATGPESDEYAGASCRSSAEHL